MSGNREPFPGLGVPEPPEDLRDRVLSRARQAMEREPRSDLWVRIWESRRARLVWSVSVLALAIGHLAVPSGESSKATEPSPLASTESAYDEELAGIASLPRLSLDARSITDSILDSGEIESDERSQS